MTTITSRTSGRRRTTLPPPVHQRRLPRCCSLVTTTFTTTDNGDHHETTDNDESRDELERLEQQTRAILVQTGGESKQEEVQELTERWSVCLSGMLEQRQQQDRKPSTEEKHHEEDVNTKTVTPHQAMERMMDLYRLWKDQEQGDQQQHQPSGFVNTSMPTTHSLVLPYQLLLRASVDTRNGPQAWSILQDWEDRYGGDLELAPQNEDYDAVLQAYAAAATDDTSTSATAEDGGVAAMVALEIIPRLELSWHAKGLPNSLSYQNAVRCLSRDPANYFDALQHTMDKFLQQFHNHTTLDEPRFQSMVLALGDAIRSYDEERQRMQPSEAMSEMAQLRCREWIDRWKNLLQHNLDWWGRRIGILEATTYRVLKILKSMDHDDNTASPSEMHLANLESMSQIVQELQDTTKLHRMQLPSLRHYSLALSAWSQLRNSDTDPQYEVLIQQHKETLLDLMRNQFDRIYGGDHQQDKQDDHDRLEATKAWNALLQTHFHSGQPDTVKRLWDENHRKPRSARIHLNEESFAIYLASLAAKRKSNPRISSKKRAEHAHATLVKLTEYDPAHRRFVPTPQHFESVMVAWSRSFHEDAALYAQKLHDQLRAAKMQPTPVHYNALITTWGFSRLPGAMDAVIGLFHEMKTEGVELDLSSYTAVLFALSRSNSVKSAMEGESILHQMQDLKTLECYNSVLYAWSRTGAPDALERCQHVLDQMPMPPDVTSFTLLIEALLNTHTRHPVPDLGSKAEDILSRLQSADLLADAKLYTAVMKAHWKEDLPDAALRVENVMKRMKDMYELGNTKVKPDAHAMSILLHTWAKSKEPAKAQIAWEIVEWMQSAFDSGDVDMKPTAHCYAAVLNACAYTDASVNRFIRSDVVKIALRVMAKMSERGDKVNKFIFRNTFKVILNHIDNIKEKTQCAGVIFQRCCQEGYVDRWTIGILRGKVPSLYKKIPLSQLPEQWSRNVTKAERFVVADTKS